MVPQGLLFSEPNKLISLSIFFFILCSLPLTILLLLCWTWLQPVGIFLVLENLKVVCGFLNVVEWVLNKQQSLLHLVIYHRMLVAFVAARTHCFSLLSPKDPITFSAESLLILQCYKEFISAAFCRPSLLSSVEVPLNGALPSINLALFWEWAGYQLSLGNTGQMGRWMTDWVMCFEWAGFTASKGICSLHHKLLILLRSDFISHLRFLGNLTGTDRFVGLANKESNSGFLLRTIFGSDCVEETSFLLFVY